MLKADYLSILKKYWGYDDFRGVQREIVESIGAGHDTLGLMPTGGGKSITFQVPALAMQGTCVVVTPLIALMQDQVQNLRRRGIRAAAVYSGMSREQILVILENAVFGQVKLLYVSPERLSSDIFRTKLRHMTVSFICVDEAHCISQWGYDFRPSYLEIADIRHDLPQVPVLALTATATPVVVEDIQDKLSLHTSSYASSRFNVYKMSFERKNLAYVVRRAADKQDELLHILKSVAGTSIVYVRSRRRAEEYAKWLSGVGVSATFYHAGLDTPVKNERQQAWQHDKVRVMVATNAFGMGIDKPDVRLVIHVDCPDSVEAYFQEAGRAGRDDRKAYAVLLYNDHDERKLLKRVGDTFPEKDYIKKVYDHLAFYYQIATGAGYNRVFEFNVDDFCQKFRHFPIRVHSALKILNRAGYMEYIEEQESQARVMFVLGRDELDRLRSISPDEDGVVTALLRNYGGLFVDYGFIDEALIASETGLQKTMVYQTLKQLAQKHIISFIPQKRTPYVRYMQRREDSEYLLFPSEVYEDLKVRYERRIRAMIDYVKSENQCRSRQLLRYFGEENRHDCGQCDVCLNDCHAFTSQEKLTSAEERILSLFVDGQPVHVTKLRSINLPYEQIDAALEYLLREERLCQRDGFLHLC